MNALTGKLVGISGLLMTGVALQANGQCPTVAQLYHSLQVISAQADVSRQSVALQNWKSQWERCGYLPDSTYINGLLQLGLSYLNQHNLSSAAQVNQQAVRQSQHKWAFIAADQPAKALYRMGLVRSIQNDPKDALTFLNQAIHRGRGIPAAIGWVGNAHVYAAFSHNMIGDYQQAVVDAQRGAILGQTLNDTLLLARALQEGAKAQTRLGKYGDAHRSIQRSITLVQRNSSLQAVVATGYRLLGVVAEYERRSTEALQHERKAFAISRAIHDPNAPNYAVTLGMHFYKLGQYDQAIPYFNYSVKNNANLYDKAQSLDNLGAVYWKKKQFVLALRYYQLGMTVMPIRFSNVAVQSLPNEPIIHRCARKQYLLTLLQDKADTWLDYAKATDNNPQRLQHALETYRVVDQMIDYMRWEHTGQLSKLYWRQKTRGLYERAVETCYLLKDTEQAFRFFEKSRAVMLTDKLNELGARQQLTDDQKKKERELRQAVANQQTELAKLTPDSTRYISVREVLDAKQGEFEEFIKQLERTNPAYFQYKYDTTTTKLAGLQRHLNDQKATFVTYFVGDSAVYALSVDSSRARLVRLVQPVRTYKQNIQNFISLLANADALSTKAELSRFLKLGNEIYRQSLAPLMPSAGRVIVSPDRFFVPFDALSRSTSKSDYLVNTYAFDYTYSARLLLRRGQSSPTANFWEDGFLGFAPVAFAPKLGQVSLPGSDEALNAIGERFMRPKLFTHQDATRHAFKTQAPHARIIQLFTHAVADTTDREPLLYFADDTLRLSELSDSEPFNAQLAVLGACQTGVGADQAGEGVFSMARGFASLGVPSIVSTLWSVQDQATYDLTESFHQHLDEGMTKDVALQHAKQDWLKSHEGTDQSPNVWAGLILIGDAEPLSRPMRWPWVAGALLLLGAGGLGFWWWRRRYGLSR